MKKTAGLEDTGITDQVHGKPIRVSTTVRMIYRKTWNNPEFRDFSSMRNTTLNEIIARDFVNSSDKVIHYFALGRINDQQRDLGEIRNLSIDGTGLFKFFISAVRDGSVDILTIQSKYIKPVDKNGKPIFKTKEDVVRRLRWLASGGKKQLDFDFRQGR